MPGAIGSLTPGRQRVLAAALEMFSERGFAATSMRDLAEQLGMQNASLYSHYRGGKDDLLLQALAPLLDGLDTLLTVAPHLSDGNSLSQWLRTYAEHLLAHPHAARLAGADLAVARHPSIGTRLAQQNQVAREHLREALGCDETTAASILGALWWPLICLPPDAVDVTASTAAAMALTHQR